MTNGSFIKDVRSNGGGGLVRCGQMRTRGISATLLGTKASRAGIQQCTAILITTTVTVLAVLNRSLWSLNLSDLNYFAF